MGTSVHHGVIAPHSVINVVSNGTSMAYLIQHHHMFNPGDTVVLDGHLGHVVECDYNMLTGTYEYKVHVDLVGNLQNAKQVDKIKKFAEHYGMGAWTLSDKFKIEYPPTDVQTISEVTKAIKDKFPNGLPKKSHSPHNPPPAIDMSIQPSFSADFSELEAKIFAQLGKAISIPEHLMHATADTKEELSYPMNDAELVLEGLAPWFVGTRDGTPQTPQQGGHVFQIMLGAVLCTLEVMKPKHEQGYYGATNEVELRVSMFYPEQMSISKPFKIPVKYIAEQSKMNLWAIHGVVVKDSASEFEVHIQHNANVLRKSHATFKFKPSHFDIPAKLFKEKPLDPIQYELTTHYWVVIPASGVKDGKPMIIKHSSKYGTKHMKRHQANAVASAYAYTKPEIWHMTADDLVKKKEPYK